MIVPRFHKSPIDTSVVARMITFNKRRNGPIASKICICIKEELGIDPMDNTRYRGEEYVMARQLFIIFMVKLTKYTYEKIASMIGKDHSTINSALKAINNRLDTDKDYKIIYDRIATKLI
jgi:chromosomal replication initiation ATPase DnaA